MPIYDLFRNDPDLINLRAGRQLFHEGDKGDVMYVMISGKAAVVFGGIPIEEIIEGDIVGEMAIIDGSPRSASVIAESDCSLAVVSQERFQTLIAESPQFALEVMRVMAQRLRQANQIIAKTGLSANALKPA